MTRCRLCDKMQPLWFDIKRYKVCLKCARELAIILRDRGYFARHPKAPVGGRKPRNTKG